MKNLFFSVVVGEVKIDRETLKPCKEVILNVDVEGCTDVLAEEGPEALRKLLLDNFITHIDNLMRQS